MRVLIADKLPAGPRLEMERLGFEVDYQADLKDDALRDAVGEAHVLVVRSTRVTKDILEAAQRLQLIIRAGAGVNTIACDVAAALGIFVANCPGKNATAVAELTLGLILALDRRIPENVSAFQSGQWNKKRFSKANGIYGRTLGVVGLGRIGHEVIARAKAFGLHCIAWSRSLTDEHAAALGVDRCASVSDLCARADVVTVHVALTPDTTHLIGESELAQMRQGALLVNVARGGVVDDRALAAAVSEGRIRAACDVLEDEPKAGEQAFESALAALDGFYGTHHIGASTQQAQEATADEVLRILKSWKDTGDVPNCVNLSARSSASGQLMVRHLDQVGVLATVLDVLKRAAINVQEMENTMFEGGVAACAKITVEHTPSDDVLNQLATCSPNVLGVEWIALSDNAA